jgi:hypothetical protein
MHSQIDTVRRDLDSGLKTESQARIADVQTINEKLSHALTSNINNMAFGAWWLFFGIVLSSLAQEIAKLVAGQRQVVLHAM